MRNVLEKFFNRGMWVFSLFFAIAQRKERKEKRFAAAQIPAKIG